MPVQLQCRRCVLIFIYFSFFKGWLLEGCIAKQVPGLSGEYCSLRTFFLHLLRALQNGVSGVQYLARQKTPLLSLLLFYFGD